MIHSRPRSQNALDRKQPIALATQTMSRPDGSTQALDHRREAQRLDRLKQATDPLFLWPLLAALVQFVV